MTIEFNPDCVTLEELEQDERTLRELSSYAANKLSAMRARLAGDIDQAMGHETICDRIYGRLPEGVKW